MTVLARYLNFASLYGRACLRPHPHFSTAKRRFAKESVEGHTIFYEKIGNGPKTLFLMPGALGSVYSDFSTILHRFDPEKYTVIAWDPPGYGQSRPPDRTWPPRYYDRDAEVALSLMSQLGYQTYTCVGWSDGGNTAMIMAIMQPHTVEKLVIWGANSYFLEEDVNKLKAVSTPEQWSPRMRSIMEESLGADYFRKILTDFVKAVENYPNWDVCHEGLKDIRCPTLIMHGQKDPILPHFHPGVLHEGIKGSIRIDYEDGKHNLHMKYAEKFVKDVTNFLESTN